MNNVRLYFEGQFSKFESLLKEHGRENTYKRNTNINNFSRDLTIFYLKKGIVKLDLYTNSGEIKSVCFHGAGSLFPYSLARPNKNGKYEIDLDILNFKALTDLEVIQISPPIFNQILKKNPELSMTLLDYVIQHSNLFMLESINLSYESIYVRTSNFVYLYDVYLNQRGINLSQSEIGELIGAKRVDVARALKKLRDKKIITTSRSGIRVINQELLKDQCSIEF